MEFYEEQLDIVSNKLVEMEKNIALLQENVTYLSEQIKETQRYLIKLAHNQSEITKRVSSWPFIAVPEK